MPVCPNCGTLVTSNTGKIVAWCVGISMVVFLGVPLMLIFVLAAIAAIGAAANSPSKVAELEATPHPSVEVVDSKEDH